MGPWGILLQTSAATKQVSFLDAALFKHMLDLVGLRQLPKVTASSKDRLKAAGRDVLQMFIPQNRSVSVRYETHVDQSKYISMRKKPSLLL